MLTNVIHMGNHFFVGMFPFIDLDNGGSVLGYSRNIENILKQLANDVHVIPGLLLYDAFNGISSSTRFDHKINPVIC